MPRTKIAIQRLIISITALVLVAAYPLTAAADDTLAAAAPPAAPAQPSGADAATYTYNAATGLWENNYYTWNPATGQTSPKTTQTFSYNPATGRWDTTDWVYDAAQGKYVPNTVSVVTPPAGAPTVGGPSTSSSTDTAAATQGPDSPVTASNNSTGLFDNFYNASISNTLNSSAATGNASVSVNTTAGDAASGNAMAMATILNILQSATSLQGGNMTTFTKDVGNWQGDLIIDPSQLSNLQTLSPNSTPNNLTINTKTGGQINNNINLAAASGDAAVTQNTTGGSAATGDAAAIANIVNVINSIIGAGQSFIGTININGNLDGDILLPQNTLNSLLASGSVPTLTTVDNSGNTLKANLTDNSSITNQLNLAAKSGTAGVTDNTTAGNAATGSSSTNLTLLNLTGKQVVGSDALLVFVNVMGKWVGMIVNAPGGSSSAALCSCTSTDNNLGSNTNLTSNTNNRINNNVNLNSTSGNALVSQNTRAGNATSGNALAGVNLLNISTSSLSLSNWLGILFINVFGSWNGSFGIDTAAGNKPLAGGSGGGPTTTISKAVKSVKVFSFVPTSGSNTSFKIIPVTAADSPSVNSNDNNHPSVLGAAIGNNNTPQAPLSSHRNTSLLGTEEIMANRKAARAKFRKYLHSVTVQPLKRY
jgi:hypothetical protein